ncbi:unnamed protein product [Prunus armeniaca]
MESANIVVNDTSLLQIPSLDNPNNLTPEATNVDDDVINDSITSPTPQIHRHGAKQVQKDHSLRNVIGNVHHRLKTRKQVSEEIMRNKARLDAQGYRQIEGLDFDKTFAPVARLEAIRLLLSIVCHLMFKLHQMDLKSAFLNGVLQEEVYVEQPARFIDPINPYHVYRLKKVQQFNEGIFISQTKYAKNLVSKFGMEFAKAIQNPMSTSDKLCKDSKGKSVDQKLYRSMIGSLIPRNHICLLSSEVCAM